MKRYALYILLLGSSLIFPVLSSGCSLEDVTNPDKEKREDFESYMFHTLIASIMTGDFRSYSLADNADGTVSVTLSRSNGVRMTQVYKKCLQGQVYRPLPDNDCQGTGSVSDHYGALLLQFCSQNDDSCTPGATLDGSGISEVYSSCVAESPTGTWKAPYSYYIFAAPNWRDVYMELPEFGQFWTEHAARLEVAHFESPGLRERDYKTARKFVLCRKTYSL